MLNELKDTLSNLNAQRPILAWSGGKDSTFLLQLMLSMGLRFSVLTLHHLWTKEQFKFVKDMIEEHKLTVFFYAPLAVNYTRPYVTVDYQMGGTVIKKIMDHYHSNRCGLDAGREAVAEQHLQPPYIWDATVVGTKKSDSHELVDRFDFKDVPGHRFIKPLWDWTNDQVVDTAEALGFKLDRRDDPRADTGHYVACMACLETDASVYCPKEGRSIRGIK
jgi:3'-phosphoadenosine 5'-phosphosulfate sulfotransferase (PAPS reductase)/FAD synthetase